MPGALRFEVRVIEPPPGTPRAISTTTGTGTAASLTTFHILNPSAFSGGVPGVAEPAQSASAPGSLREAAAVRLTK